MDLKDLPVAFSFSFFFSLNWEKLTSGSFIQNQVQGYQILLLKPAQNYVLAWMVQMNQEQVLLIDQEIQKMLRKRAIKKVQLIPDQFLNSIIVIPKKDTVHCPVIYLKKLNTKKIPYGHFKMEVLFHLKEVLQKGDYMCKINLKDAYFSVPLYPGSQIFVRFQWMGHLF